MSPRKMTVFRKNQRLFGFLANSMLILAGILFAFAIFEGMARIFFAEPLQPRFVVDSGYGVRATQSNLTTTHSSPGEYQITIRTNGEGMRGVRDYSPQRPPSTYRIALIGDSFVYGHGVDDENVVSNILELLLNQVDDKTAFEVLNFGTSGFGTAQEYITYQHKVRKFEPDLVIIFYFNNDVGNVAVSDLFDFDDKGSLARTDKTYLPGVKLRQILYSFGPIRWLFEHSQAWNIIRNRLSSLVHRRYLDEKGLRSYSEGTAEALRLTEAVFEEFLKHVRRDGAISGIFVIPDRKLFSNFPFDNDELKRLSSFFIDGRGIFGPEDYWARDGHWKPEGHRKAALAISTALDEVRARAFTPASTPE